MPLRPAPASLRSPPPPRYSSVEVEDSNADLDSQFDAEANSQTGDGDEETDVVTGLDGRPVRGEPTGPAAVDGLRPRAHILSWNDLVHTTDETIFEASGPGMSTKASMRKDGRISVIM